MNQQRRCFKPRYFNAIGADHDYLGQNVGENGDSDVEFFLSYTEAGECNITHTKNIEAGATIPIHECNETVSPIELEVY